MIQDAAVVAEVAAAILLLQRPVKGGDKTKSDWPSSLLHFIREEKFTFKPQNTRKSSDSTSKFKGSSSNFHIYKSSDLKYLQTSKHQKDPFQTSKYAGSNYSNERRHAR